MWSSAQSLNSPPTPQTYTFTPSSSGRGHRSRSHHEEPQVKGLGPSRRLFQEDDNTTLGGLSAESFASDSLMGLTPRSPRDARNMPVNMDLDTPRTLGSVASEDPFADHATLNPRHSRLSQQAQQDPLAACMAGDGDWDDAAALALARPQQAFPVQSYTYTGYARWEADNDGDMDCSPATPKEVASVREHREMSRCTCCLRYVTEGFCPGHNDTVRPYYAPRGSAYEDTPGWGTRIFRAAPMKGRKRPACQPGIVLLPQTYTVY